MLLRAGFRGQELPPGEQKLSGQPASLLTDDVQKMSEPTLVVAARMGKTEAVRRLIAGGADVEAKDYDGATGLHWASLRGRGEVARVLLDAGANVQATYLNMGTMPLHFAAAGQGSEEVARMLLAAGARVDGKSDIGVTPLHVASRNGHEGVVRVLLAARADVAGKASDGTAPLHCAAESGREGTLRILLDAGADVAMQASDGWSALHHAAANGHEGAARVLLHAGADVSSKDVDTPLHQAAVRGHAGVARVLLHAGADGEAADYSHLEVQPPDRFCPLVFSHDCAVSTPIRPVLAHLPAREPRMRLTLNCAAKVMVVLRAVATERARGIAFAMGLRERLGAGSPVRALDPEVVRMVLDRV